MAHMIPASPRFHTTADHEDEIFNALKKGLSDEYTIIHSFFYIAFVKKQFYNYKN